MASTTPSSNEYLNYLQQLMPPGRAYLRKPGQIITKLLHGIADILADFHATACEVFLRNIDPCKADLARSHWLKSTGIHSDPCLTETDDCAAMLAVLRAGASEHEGQEVAYYKSLLMQIGIAEADIEIAQGAPLSECGVAQCGDELSNAGGAFTWSVTIKNASQYPGWECIDAECGTAECLDPIGHCRIVSVECLINKFKPSHTTVIFYYEN
jgi:uncharacterized protein YmfQ (DUF2313 family)